MSNYLKIYRALNNDSDFTARVEIACSLEGVTYDRDALIHVAKATVESITISDEGAIDSSNVEDEQIAEALRAYLALGTEEDTEGQA